MCKMARNEILASIAMYFFGREMIHVYVPVSAGLGKCVVNGDLFGLKINKLSKHIIFCLG